MEQNDYEGIPLGGWGNWMCVYLCVCVYVSLNKI